MQDSLEQNRKDKNIRENNFGKYRDYLKVLWIKSSLENLKPEERNNIFKENSELIEDKRVNLKKEKQENKEKIVESLWKKKDISVDLEETVNELLYFKNRANLLPKRLSDIRQIICKNLDIDESEIFLFVSL